MLQNIICTLMTHIQVLQTTLRHKVMSYLPVALTHNIRFEIFPLVHYLPRIISYSPYIFSEPRTLPLGKIIFPYAYKIARSPPVPLASCVFYTLPVPIVPISFPILRYSAYLSAFRSNALFPLCEQSA